MATVLLVAEQSQGKLRSASLCGVTFGQKLLEAAGGGDIVALVPGEGITEAAKQLATAGVSKVVTADSPELATYLAETYAPLVAQAAKSVGADYVVATATSTGKDLMPRVAALLDVGMASDVASVEGPRTFKRPMVAGNAIATIEVSTDKMVATCRQSEWDAAATGGAEAAIESLDPGTIDPLGAQVISIDQVKSERPELTEASVVVSGGRGMKIGENFEYLEKLADVLGGAMGATRAACDAGLVPNDLQVGQTGKVVAPDLYIAVGISGAIQHLAGMKGSKVIVAINKDPEAPIFQVADYGLVAKWEDTVEDLTGKIEQIKSAG